MNAWLAVAGIVVGLVGAGGIASVITKHMEIRAEERKTATSGGKENQLIDQYQEHAASQDAKIERLENRMDASYRRERVRDDYIAVLRQHIADGKPPPPPPFPPGLLAGGSVEP